MSVLTPCRPEPDQQYAAEPDRRWSSTRLLPAIGASALVGVSLATDPSVLFVVAVLFLLVVPFEKLFPRHRGQRVRRPEVRTDLAYAIASPVLNTMAALAGLVIGVLSLAWIPGLLLRPLVALIPGAILPFVGIALFDLAIYWVHRWSHEVPLLWRFHSVHHSTRTLDWVSGFRGHPLDGAILAPPIVVLLVAGFDPVFTGVLAVVQIATGLFLHANVRWRFRLLHRIVITPEFHHWHHANEPDAINANYSVFLPVWDTLFGTYSMPYDRRPVVYGISEPIPTTMMGQLHHPFRGMGNPLRLAVFGVRHPFRTLCSALCFARRLLGEIRASTIRSRRSRPAPGGPHQFAPPGISAPDAP
jgi:sterol desaturase/sphingolipid hydroxylase (fatty acid hydroxylase superfamily)